MGKKGEKVTKRRTNRRASPIVKHSAHHRRITQFRLLSNCLVPTTSRPVALSPLLFVRFHLGRVRGSTLTFTKSALETTLATLAQEVKDKAGDTESSEGSSTAVDANVGCCAQFVPFLGKRLGGFLRDFFGGSGVSTIDKSS